MNKHDAIRAVNSAVVTIRGDVAYDADEIVVQYNETAVQAYMNANAYKAKRATAYPSIADQLDLMYHGGYDAWKAAIQSVKEEFPK